ncbi:MAG: glycosyl transferase [Marinosulfonomonas sp.]|nr:glycosyl transferase [Marinosulfonomonas sp.]
MTDRPLSRRAIKLAFSVFAGRNYAHAQDCWPHLSIIKPKGERNGSILWKNQKAGSLIDPISFLSSFHAKPIIFGSGPSLKNQDLSRVSPERAVLLNGAINLIPQLGGAFSVVIEDERFIWRHHEMIARLVPNETIFLLSPAVIRALLSLDRNWCQHRSIVLLDKLEKPYCGSRRSLKDPGIINHIVFGNDAALSTKPEIGVVSAGTVAFSAVQFSLAANISQIGLAGIDLANANQPRFYESGDNAKSGIVNAKARILAHFALADAHAKKLGVDIICHSSVSGLRDIGIAYRQTIS